MRGGHGMEVIRLMRIVYYDESGDDGYPKYSSELFVLSAVYMPYLAWHGNFDALHSFRRRLKKKYGLPVRTEFHTRQFLVNKKPYRWCIYTPTSRRVWARYTGGHPQGWTRGESWIGWKR